MKKNKQHYIIRAKNGILHLHSKINKSLYFKPITFLGPVFNLIAEKRFKQ